MSSGSNFTCIIKQGLGHIQCWNQYTANMYGELNPPASVQFKALKVKSSAQQSCALASHSLDIHCWGFNSNLQFNIEDREQSSQVAAYSLGLDQICVVSAQSRVRCFGNNARGDLDIPDALRQSVRSVQVGYVSNCVIKKIGSLQCWNAKSKHDEYQYKKFFKLFGTEPNDIRTVGIGSDIWVITEDNRVLSHEMRKGVSYTHDESISYLNMNKNEKLIYLEVNLNLNGQQLNENLCFLNLDRKLICNGIETPSHLNKNTISISMGELLSCGMHNSGYVSCWQSLPTPTTNPPQQPNNPTPRTSVRLDVPNHDIMHNQTQVAVGYTSKCTLRSINQLSCTGKNTQGSNDIPFASREMNTQVGTGLLTTCSRDMQGKVHCWGADVDGMVSGTPRRAALLVAVGSRHACIISAANDLLCWGFNLQGQLDGEGVSRVGGGEKGVEGEKGVIKEEEIQERKKGEKLDEEKNEYGKDVGFTGDESRVKVSFVDVDGENDKDVKRVGQMVLGINYRKIKDNINSKRNIINSNKIYKRENQKNSNFMNLKMNNTEEEKTKKKKKKKNNNDKSVYELEKEYNLRKIMYDNDIKKIKLKLNDIIIKKEEIEKSITETENKKTIVNNNGGGGGRGGKGFDPMVKVKELKNKLKDQIAEIEETNNEILKIESDFTSQQIEYEKDVEKAKAREKLIAEKARIEAEAEKARKEAEAEKARKEAEIQRIEAEKERKKAEEENKRRKKEEEKRQKEEYKRQMKEKEEQEKAFIEAELKKIEQVQQEKARAEAEAAELAKIEKARLEAEAKEKARIEKINAEKARVEAEKAKIEKARIEAEAAEKAKIEKARLEAEAAEKARIERAIAEAKAAEKARIEKIKAEAAEKARIERAIAEAEAAEKDRIEKINAEKARVERAIAEAEAAEKARIDKINSENSSTVVKENANKNQSIAHNGFSEKEYHKSQSSISYENYNKVQDIIASQINSFKHPQSHSKLKVFQVAVGGSHTCHTMMQLKESGLDYGVRLLCYGLDSSGQVQIPPLATHDTKFISAGQQHTCVIAASTASIACWGFITQPQTDTLRSHINPDLVEFNQFLLSSGDLPGMLTSGTRHSCLHTSLSQVYCWGSNQDGQTDFNKKEVGVGNAWGVQAGYDETNVITKNGILLSYGKKNQEDSNFNQEKNEMI